MAKRNATSPYHSIYNGHSFIASWTKAQKCMQISTLQNQYTSYRGDSATVEDDVVETVVLAEHMSVLKAGFLQAGATFPRISRFQYLVRNPIWGMFEPDVPVEDIAAAWESMMG
eukprot:gb/GECG01014354.1/.p1 GENE.gb/GECG01014354.1/~~gb/GECG01014354.1/.p1  ORF type:complete len:114 (+),score=13.48 gb/GECG01014354.1/:1-342(+)